MIKKIWDRFFKKNRSYVVQCLTCDKYIYLASSLEDATLFFQLKPVDNNKYMILPLTEQMKLFGNIDVAHFGCFGGKQ